MKISLLFFICLYEMKKAPSKWKGAYRNDYLINKETNFTLQQIDLFLSLFSFP